MLNIFSRILSKAGRIAISSAEFINKKSNSYASAIRVEGVAKVINDEIPEIKSLYLNVEHEKAPEVVLLIPSLIASSFFGGVATALIVAAKVALLSKRNLSIVQTGTSGYLDKGALEAFYKRSGLDTSNTEISVFDVSNRSGVDDTANYIVSNELDIFVVSAWGDAHSANRFKLKHKFIYMVQDYEPIFYPNSDKFILAENTYHYGTYIPLCNTKLMHLNMIQKGYDIFSKYPFWFEPAVSNFKSGITSRNKKRNMFLYGRPSVPRNLFYSVVIALENIFKNNLLNPNEWNIYMAGQDNLPTIELLEGVKIVNLGKMDVKDYIDFSKSIDLAISLMMAPHPNYPTLEFASIGSAVVTTKYAVKEDLSFYSKNILSADLTIQSISENILKAADMSYDARINNLQYNNIPTDWNIELDNVVKNVLSELTQVDG